MKAVGIKNLKNSLSHYLKMVRQGELIYVTDHDQIIAEIHAPTIPHAQKISRWECFLNQLEREGSLICAQKTGTNIKENTKKNSQPDLDWKNIYDLAKEERF